MKRVLMLLVLAILGVAAWYFFVTKKKPKEEVPQQQPLVVSKHSDSFNVSVNRMLNTYYTLTENFVNWDSAAVNSASAQLKKDLDAVNFNELKKDTPIYETAVSYIDASKTELDNISQTADLTAKRKSLNVLSQNMYDLLRTIRYDQAKVYLQECPMAFNDNDPGDWLSKTSDIRNPYLGMHHPKYGKGMLECGNTKDTLNYLQTPQK